MDQVSDRRLSDLHNRLATWWYGSFVEGSELRGIWDDAFRRFDRELQRVLAAHPDEEERVFATPSTMLLDCFEDALTDHDHIVGTFPHELPEGWHEWLPFPPGSDG